jgi:hypothetical protein
MGKIIALKCHESLTTSISEYKVKNMHAKATGVKTRL